MQLSKKDVPKLRRFLSCVLTGVFTVNIFAMVNVSTNSLEQRDYAELRNNIIADAAKYLSGRMNTDGSFGDSRTVNDTSDALIALRAAGSDSPAKSVEWLRSFDEYVNVDVEARKASAICEKDIISGLKDVQYSDGGFGLSKGFASDVLDSMLVLDAVNETNYDGSDISADNLCTYLLSAVNSDGGYSYNDANDSDIRLTEMTVYNIGRYFTSKNYDLGLLGNSVTYLENNVNDDYSDKCIEDTVGKYLAMSECGVEFDSLEVLEFLDKAQKKNGSFASDIHVTSLTIRLLKSLDIEEKLRITSFNTKLSDTTGNTAQSTAIRAVTNISYISNYDASADLYFTVYNGDAKAYEKKTALSLPQDETAVEAVAAEFSLAEPDDNGIYVLIELYKGDELLRSQRIDIELEGSESSYSTEISDLAVFTDRTMTYTGTDGKVNVNYALLYATNVERTVEMRTAVTCGGKTVASTSEEAALTLQSNTVTGTPFSFDADTSKAGTYEITVSCYYEGEEVCSNTEIFTVVEAPVISEPEEGEETQLEINWFGPVLSDYYLYSGTEQVVSAAAEANYFSNAEFKGTVRLAAYKGDELITEASSEAVLEVGIPSYFEGKANYPIYNSDEILTFTVDRKGEIDVVAQLIDADGNVIKEGSRKLVVVDKPVQDLILISDVNENEKNMIDLAWNNISNDDETYSYQLYRRTNSGKWEPRSIWNEEETIDVLNVYPLQPYLETWMTTTISDTELPAGKGIFNIDSVHIGTFNNDPASYLKNDDGSWKYDVIFFGSSDVNSGYDISAAAHDMLQDYIDSGRGVLFGHDTMCGLSSSYHPNFNDFAKQMGLVIKIPNPEVWYRTTSVSVVKIGTLTNYPWTIRGDLTVPNTHSTGQFNLDAIEWMTLNAQRRVDEETGAIDNSTLQQARISV